jgi:hypothetical protein
LPSMNEVFSSIFGYRAKVLGAVWTKNYPGFSRGNFLN